MANEDGLRRALQCIFPRPLPWLESPVRSGDGHLIGLSEWRETHISIVILSRHSAHKLRKPVNLGFLDYSSRQRRRRHAASELAIGRRISPHVYRGVVFMRRRGAQWELSDEPPGEPLVEMTRLRDELRLDRLCDSKSVRPAALRRLAKQLALFHAQSPCDRRRDGWGALRRVRDAWEVNFTQMPADDRTVPLRSKERALLVSQTSDWLERARPTLACRVDEGRVREGHGDLRAEHVYLSNRLTIIDPLEFDRSLRWSDVAAEVAFVAMELDAAACAETGNRLLAEYANVTRDESLPDVVPFFKRYRAVVRAKVEWIRSRQAKGALASEHRARSRRLFDLALSYSLEA